MFKPIRTYIRSRKDYRPYILWGVLLLAVLEVGLPFLLRWIVPALVGWASTMAWIIASGVVIAIYAVHCQHIPTSHTPPLASRPRTPVGEV